MARLATNGAAYNRRAVCCLFGKRLVEALRRIARREKCGRMEWLVLGWNKPAIRFYEKLGARRLKEWLPYRMSTLAGRRSAPHS